MAQVTVSRATVMVSIAAHYAIIGTALSVHMHCQWYWVTAVLVLTAQQLAWHANGMLCVHWGGPTAGLTVTGSAQHDCTVVHLHFVNNVSRWHCGKPVLSLLFIVILSLLFIVTCQHNVHCVLPQSASVLASPLL